MVDGMHGVLTKPPSKVDRFILGPGMMESERLFITLQSYSQEMIEPGWQSWPDFKAHAWNH